MPKGHASFADWNEDSARRFAKILAPLVAAELSRNEAATLDAAYLASLSKEDYAKHLKGANK